MSMKKKVVWLPYDMDTAAGTNNEGALVFGYELEDTDHLAGGADIFNGQDSVIWNNIRMAFSAELAAMYKTLRSTGALSYAKVEQMFEQHQAKWPEAIFNEDAWFKYIDPLVQDGSGAYLDMMQGSKAEQRKWWLYNRFRYIDSKYNAGDALSDLIQLRGYAKADITVTPYADIYPSIKYGSYLVQERGQRGTPTTLVCPLDNVNDTEIYIYSSSQLASVGDLSGLKVGFADFSMATRLQSIKIGDPASSYENTNLASLTLGNNALLKKLDVRNCSGLGDTSITGHTQTSVDISHCEIIEEVYFDGTKIQGLVLPNGGALKKLHLPETMANLTIMNQAGITEFVMPSYQNITTLRIENCGSAVPVEDILAEMPANSRVRLIGLNLTVSSTDEVEDFYDFLDTMRGLDENGNNMETAQVSGTITGLGTITGAWYAQMQARYPYITIEYEHITSSLYYYNGNTLLNTETIVDGGNGTYSGTPSKSSTAQYSYTFAGWSKGADDNTVDADAKLAVIADRNIYACYTATVRTYTVYFYVGTTLKQTTPNVPYGGSASYTGEAPVDPSGAGMNFTGWLPSPSNITGNTSCYAQFADPEPAHTITDTWEEILAHVQAGDYATRYSIGDTMSLDLGFEGYINMQIAAFDAEPLANGNGNAHISFISEQLLKTSHRMNPALETNYKYESGASFVRSSSYANNTGYNDWNSKNVGTTNNTAKITLTVTAVSNGTLRIEYKPSRTNLWTSTLKINGTDVSSSSNVTDARYALELTYGTTYVIEFENTRLSEATTENVNIKLCNTTGTGTKAEVDALVTQDSVVIENCIVRSIDNYTVGTGAIGGWEQSEIRAYLKDTIKPLIPQVVRNAILEVTKTQQAYNTSGTSQAQTSTEDVWIPGRDEVIGNNSLYYALFQDTSANRMKYKPGSSSASWWCLRSAYGNNYFSSVSTSGDWGTSSANRANGVVVGFCI